jgi:hypothetical protein
MSLFEFTFALSAVILGLALTQVAASLHKLLLAGRQVRWAAEPVLLTLIVVLVIVSVWAKVSVSTLGLPMNHWAPVSPSIVSTAE